MMKEEDILYQNGDFWVCGTNKGGYEVLKDRYDGLYAEVVMHVGYKGVKGFERAVLECDKRANNH